MSAKLAKSLVASTLVAALLSASAYARPASQMRDLVGARAGQAEGQLEARGFTNIGGHKGKTYVHSYWWNASDKNCIDVRTADGRYAAIVDTPNSDCNQKDRGGSSGAAVAGVAVGALLIAALASSHKSSHHDDGKHLSDQVAEQEYDRGYRDGLHNVAYHNYNKNDAYSSGYEAGVDQRGRETEHHSGRRGYGGHTSVADLQGTSSIRAFDVMTERGFRSVDSFSSGNTQYGIYWKGSTGQCVQLTNADGQVYDARDIGTHPKCRN